jgi:hypothetical protein
MSGDFAASLTDVVAVDELVLNFFCVDDEAHLPRLLAAIADRGDSIIVGLGRPVVPAVTEAARRYPGRVFIWIGWGPPPSDLPAEVLRWWMNPDSLQKAVTELAILETTPKAVALFGDVVSPAILSLLQGNDILVEQYSIAESLLHESSPIRAEGAPSLILQRPKYERKGAQNQVYWAAEGPSGAERRVEVELRTDWLGAVSNALDWHFHRGGTPPGAGPDRWLTIEKRESEGDSP